MNTTKLQTIHAVDSLEELIGETPLLRLKKISVGMPAQLLVKLEMLNPGGSSKDRPALEMINAAEADGKLLPGGTIIEPTSGNTGVGLAIIAAQRGYKTIFVVTDKVSGEKIDLLRAYGAQVVVCPVAVAPEDPCSYYSVAERLTLETPNSFRPDQYSNQNNPLSHYKTTGPEIWEQTGGKITHFVAGIGTGGTISGVGKYLKEQNPNIKIVGADPINSVFSGGSGRPYLTEGVGEDFWPSTFDPNLVDITIQVSDAQAFSMTRQIACEEGLLIGGSGAMAIVAALELAPDLKEDDVVVVLLPDSGRGYLSKIFNEDWMVAYGFLERPDETGLLVSDLFDDFVPDQNSIISVNPESTMDEAIELINNNNIAQVIVAKGKAPFAVVEIVGSLNKVDILKSTTISPELLNEKVSNTMDAPLTTIGFGESLSRALNYLEEESALVVIKDGMPTSAITQKDVRELLKNKNR
ncbi:MAG: cystathionine beta-synthase [Acidimicrobiia bacterium]